MALSAGAVSVRGMPEVNILQRSNHSPEVGVGGSVFVGLGVGDNVFVRLGVSVKVGVIVGVNVGV